MVRHHGLHFSQFDYLARLDAPAQGLKPIYTPRWLLFADIPWFPAIGDGTAINIGCGCDELHEFALKVSTTCTMRAIFWRPHVDIRPGLWRYRLVPCRVVFDGVRSKRVKVLEWVDERLQHSADSETQLARVTPDSHGFTKLPRFVSGHSVNWRADAHGAMTGLNINTSPAEEILAAALECVALRRPVVDSTEKETRAHGAAMLGLERLGAVARLREIPSSTGDIFLSSSEFAPAYGHQLVAMKRSSASCLNLNSSRILVLCLAMDMRVQFVISTQSWSPSVMRSRPQLQFLYFLLFACNGIVSAQANLPLVIDTISGGNPTYRGDAKAPLSLPLFEVRALAVDPQGNLFIADAIRDEIYKIAGGEVFVFARSVEADGMAFDASGNLYVAVRFQHRILRYTPAGEMTVVAGTGTSGYSGDGGPATQARLNQPTGVSVDAQGNILISERGNSTVRRISPAGIIQTLMGTGQSGFAAENVPAAGQPLA